MINEVVSEDKKEEKKAREYSEVEILKQKIKDLEDQNKKLMSVNATLLFNKNLEKI
jgi:hypothetical protein